MPLVIRRMPLTTMLPKQASINVQPDGSIAEDTYEDV